MKLILTLFVLLISPSVLSKDETLFCSQDQHTGFKDTDSTRNYKQVDFVEQKFKAKINFNNEIFSSNDLKMADTTCVDYGSFMQCIDLGYSISINKKSYNFILSKGFGHLGSDGIYDTISISYGTCEKF